MSEEVAAVPVEGEEAPAVVEEEAPPAKAEPAALKMWKAAELPVRLIASSINSIFLKCFSFF
jgi:hypothetical protein